MVNNGNNKQHNNVLQLQCEPIECVRIGFIGLGVRAKRAVHRMMHIDGCRITALCDLVEENIADAKSIITEYGGETPVAYCDKEGWKQLCQQPDVDLVYICTDWASHADIAVYAMQQGKHVATEVPAATTVADCWLFMKSTCQLLHLRSPLSFEDIRSRRSCRYEPSACIISPSRPCCAMFRVQSSNSS